MRSHHAVIYILTIFATLSLAACGSGTTELTEVGDWTPGTSPPQPTHQTECVESDSVHPDLPDIPREPSPQLTYLQAPANSSTAVIYDLAPASGSGNGDLISLKHSLDAFGIPYTVTRDLDEALSAREFLLVAGRIASVEPIETRNRIRDELPLWAAEPGKTLWLSGIRDELLLEEFGVEVGSESFGRSRLLLDPAHPLNKYVDTPEEEEVWLARPQQSPEEFIRTRSYRQAETGGPWQFNPAGSYAEGGDGLVLLEHQEEASARVVLAGMKFNDLITRMENELHTGHTRGNVNLFEPSTDTVKLWFRTAYEEWTENPHIREFAPEGKDAAVILTHDIDASNGIVPLRDQFMPLEESYGWRSTLFVTTSFFSTGWIGPFYTEEVTQQTLQRAVDRGYDLQNHSVTHLIDIQDWPIGDPIAEPDTSLYKPVYNRSTEVSDGGQVLPEMLIPTTMLRSDFGVEVRGWRTGHLFKLDCMGSLLQETGHAYDSSQNAGRTGGSFPFVMMANYFFSGEEARVLEFPMALNDIGISEVPDEEVARSWIETTEGNISNNAPTGILIHPTNPGDKLPPYEEYLEWLDGRDDVWVGPMDDYYQWYREQGIRSEIE